MEDNYISDLPEAPVLQMGLPETPNLDKIFQSSLPQYTRVAEFKEPTREEKIASIADNISNSKLTSNYTPNVLAPIEVGIDTSKYEGVDISLAKLQSGSMEQYAAQTQSYWDRLWNDTKVTGANLGIGFATAFTSIYDMINDGSFIPGEDSATSNLGRISSKFAEENTNFQTQYDVDNPIKSLLLPSFLTGSSKGWGEIAKSASIGIGTGLGIVAQELAIGAVTGGVGSIPILANNIRNLIRGSKTIAQAAETASALRAGTTSIAQGIREVGALEGAISAGNITKNIIEFGKNTVRGALSAYGESAFEAQETRDSFTLDKIKEYKEKNGYLPSGADLDKIKNVAEQAHDARFLLNFGLLTFSNMPFNNSIFKQFDDVMSISEQAAAKGLKYTGKAADGFEKSFQLTSNWWSKNAVTKGMKTALETGQPYAKNIFTGKSITWNEGLEEGYQFWVDKATNNYYNTIYNKGTNDVIDGTLTDTIYGLANSFYKTKEQLISTEGLQNIIGGIMGGTGQSIFSKGLDTSKLAYQASKIASDPKNNTTFGEEYKKLTGQWKEGSQFRIDTTSQIEEGKKDLLDIQKAINLNSITGDLQSKIEAVRGAYTGAGLMEETNSVVTFDKLKDITKFHTIAPMVMRGQSDILKEQLTSTLEDVTDDEFKLMTGLENITPGIKQQYISKVIEDVNKVEKSVKRNLSTFRNKYQKGTEEYDLYENAKKVFAFHGYMSENMMERKKDLESKNSILFNAPNITAALELATQGTNREGLLNQIKQRKNQFESDIRIATPVVKEGEETVIDEQTQQLIERAQAQIDTLTELETEVNGFKGENVKEVIDLINNVLSSFNQLELIQDDSTLNLQNQLDKILNTFTDHQILSSNLADHLETYNNLVQNYSDSEKLKEVLDKYKTQGMIVQSSFEGLKEINKQNEAIKYFFQKASEAGLPKDSEFYNEIIKGMKELQLKNAELQEYKDLIDKNIAQFIKEKENNLKKKGSEEDLQFKEDLLTFKNSLENVGLNPTQDDLEKINKALEYLKPRYNKLIKIDEKDLNEVQEENIKLLHQIFEIAQNILDNIPSSEEYLRNLVIEKKIIEINGKLKNITVLKNDSKYLELKKYIDDLIKIKEELKNQKEKSKLRENNEGNIDFLIAKIEKIIKSADDVANEEDINNSLNGNAKLTKEQIDSISKINKLIEDGKKAVLIDEALIKATLTKPEKVKESHYSFLGKLYQRVTNFFQKGDIFDNTDTVTNLMNAVVVGNYFDTFARLYYNNPNLTQEQFENELKKRKDYNQLSQIDVKDLFEGSKTRFLAIKKQIQIDLKDNNLVFITDNIFVHSDFKNGEWDGIAGILDMVVVNSKGKVYIYDFKTKSENSSKATIDSIESKRYGESYQEKWTKQQTAYSRLFKDTFGYVPDINIIVIPITYKLQSFTGKFDSFKDREKFKPIPSKVKFGSEPFIYKLKYDENNKLVVVLNNIKPNETDIDRKIIRLNNLKDLIAITDDLTTIESDIYKVIEKDLYDKWKKRLDEDEVNNDVDEIIPLDATVEELLNGTNRYLYNNYIDEELLILQNTPSNKTIEELVKEITYLREEELKELRKIIPNIDEFKKDGIIDEEKLLKEKLSEKVLKEYNKIYRRYNVIIKPLLNDLEAKKVANPEDNIPIEDYTKKGSIKSKILESIIFTNKDNEVEYIEENEEVFKTHVSLISNLIQDKLTNPDSSIDLNTLKLRKIDKILPKKDIRGTIVNLQFDKALARKTAENGIEITDDKGNYLMLVQSPENLYIDVPFILSYQEELFKDLPNRDEIIAKLSKYTTTVSLLEAIDSFLDPTLYKLLNEISVEVYNEITQKTTTQPLLQLRENYTDFVNILKTQKEKYDTLYNTEDSKMLNAFKSLYELDPYANGMNPNKEGKFGETKFTEDLSFNYIGKWKNPIFQIDEKDGRIIPENVEGFTIKEFEYYEQQIKNKLDQLKEKTPTFYDILIDKGTYFTIFSTESGEIFIKHIELRKYNARAIDIENNLNLENELFDKDSRELTTGVVENIKNKYLFFAYDKNKEGNSIKIDILEKDDDGKKSYSVKFLVFYYIDGVKTSVDYYLNNVTYDEMADLLSGKFKPNRQPFIAKSFKEKLEKDKTLPYSKFLKQLHNFSIIEKIAATPTKLLDGTYSIPNVNNETSVFQNVGFRLKFKEKQGGTIIPGSLIPEKAVKPKAKKVTKNPKAKNPVKKPAPPAPAKDFIDSLAENEANKKRAIELFKEIRKRNIDLTRISPEDQTFLAATLTQEMKDLVDMELNISKAQPDPFERETAIKLYLEIKSGTKAEFNLSLEERLIYLKYKDQFEEIVETELKDLQKDIEKIEILGWNNLTGLSDVGVGKEGVVWSDLQDKFKNKSDTLEILRKFEELKSPDTKALEKKKLRDNLKSYFNTISVKNYEEKTENPDKDIPNFRAIIDNKEVEEIAKQYTINCK